MLNSYHRRAFLALAVFAIEPLAAPAARADEPQTLWEALNHVERNPARAANPDDPDEPTRVPLGAVPGFSLPAQDRVGDPGSRTGANSKKKMYRGPLAPFSRLWNQFLTATGSNIDVRGDASITLRQDSVSGGSQATQAFQDQNYLGQGSGGVYTNASLNVDATMFKYFHYNSTISNSPYRSPGQNRVKLDYNTKKTRVQVGDINAGFQGNSLIDFNRYLSGVEVQNQWTHQFKTSVLYSITKAETKSYSTPGNNSAGPYYLFAGQIVDGSAQVQVDNRPMKPGVDFTLDPNTGELRFLNGNVILQSQTIAITYETQGYNLTQGTIYGLRSQWTAHGANGVGFTYVTQQSPTGQQLTQRKQQFQGQEIALAGYTLDAPIDTTKPYSVTIGGILLAQGTAAAGDYFIDSAFPNVIHLRNPVPSLQNVIVTYYPLDNSPTPGSRNVMGVDGHLGLGKWGSLTLEGAMSGLNLASQNYGGKAAQIRADLTPFKNLTTHFILRDVGNTYSSIQTPGFNRNEKSVELSGEYTPFHRLHLSFEGEYAKRPSYSYSGVTSTNQYNITSPGNDTYKQYTLGASYDLARNTKINLSTNSLGTNYLAGGQSTSSSDNLSLNWSHRSLTFDVGMIRNVSDTNSPNGYFGLTVTPTTTTAGTAASQAYNARSATTTERASLGWQALKWMHLDGSVSENAITSSGTAYTNGLTHTNATDQQFTARISPPFGKRLKRFGKNLTFIYSYDLSDTGNNGVNIINGVVTPATGVTGTGITTGTTTGTTTGVTTTTPSTGLATGGVVSTRSLFTPWIGPPTRQSLATGGDSTATGISTASATAGGGINSTLGAAGNYSGYLGSSTTNTGLTSLGGRTSTNHFALNYALSDALNMNLGYDLSNSVGDYQYNSDRKSALANMSWNPSDRYSFNANFNIMHVNYTNGQGGTRSNTFQLGFTGRPFGNRIMTTFGYQNVRTTSSLSLLGTAATAVTGVAGIPTTPTTAGSGNADTALTSLSARIDVPISRRHTLFVDWLSSTATGYLGNNETDLRFGMDYYLNQFLKFSLGWQVTDRLNQDSTLANYNYHNSSLLAEFGLHF